MGHLYGWGWPVYAGCTIKGLWKVRVGGLGLVGLSAASSTWATKWESRIAGHAYMDGACDPGFAHMCGAAHMLRGFCVHATHVECAGCFGFTLSCYFTCAIYPPVRVDRHACYSYAKGSLRILHVSFIFTLDSGTLFVLHP